MLPVDEPVQFNVTSLDVIHSFWAYQLGVKADANPGVNNVAYTTARQLGRSPSGARSCAGCGTARCSTTATSSPLAAFRAWAATDAKHSWRSITTILPPYATTYDPTVIPQINKAMAKAGIAGAQRLLLPAERPGAAVTRSEADAAMKR